MKKILLVPVLFLVAITLQSFCGFYVAKADTKLYNKASEVILVRDGNQTVVTMSNDFEGDVKDFAMVVPVPQVLKEEDIKVVRKDIFNKLNLYSEPRLVEYYDDDPCYPEPVYEMEDVVAARVPGVSIKNKREKKDNGVTIEAEYTVGEYDILILSAKESNGLKYWLTDNGYKIPKNAHEVLEPYIKNKLKFFVVKVNLEEMQRLGRQELSPIQIKYYSGRFMLPIRLGMANAKNTQDLIIYAFTKNGRIESTNYRTKKIPTDKNVPTFIKPEFGQFYSDLFDKAYKKGRKQSVFLEYAWDLSSKNYVKCDPCNTTPPSYKELKDAGVFFINYDDRRRWQGADYDSDLFFTRLHVRYDRKHFPQDLQFQITPNKEQFQGRYVMHHMANVDLNSCDQARSYLNSVLDRREEELDNLKELANWDISNYDDYTNKIRKDLGYAIKPYEPKNQENIEEKEEKNKVALASFNWFSSLNLWIIVSIIIAAIVFVRMPKRKYRKH